MPAFKFTAFGGLYPKLSTRLLPDMGAQVASNVKFQSGNLRPLNDMEHIYSPTMTPPTSIYRARYDELSDWLTWTSDVDVVRAPLPSEAEPRFCWTGDYEPKFGKYSDVTSGAVNDHPTTYYILGQHAPQTAPTVTPSGGTGATVSRIYCYTFFSQDGEETEPSPLSTLTSGKVDGTWAISGMDALPVNTTSGTAAHASGVTTFTTTAAAKHWLRVGDRVKLYDVTPTLLVTTTVTAVTSSSVFKVAGNYATAVSWERETDWNVTGMKRRLYRSAGTDATFQLVSDDVNTTYNDTLSDASILGDELISDGWSPPPVGLSGLCVHASGALVGFTGNIIHFSEPNQPHAWPEKYQLTTDYDIVGMGVFGAEVAVVTTGNPYVISGVEPGSMSRERIDGLYPCVSKRSVVSIGNAVLYASSHGLVQVARSGATMFSGPFFSRDEWSDYNPETMFSEVANGRVYVSYETDTSGVYSVMIFDGDILVNADANVTELYTDGSTGELYTGTTDGVCLWDSINEVPLTASWRSKSVVLPKATNFGAAKVEFQQALDPDVEAAMLAAIAAAEAANAAILTSGEAGGAPGMTYLGEHELGGSDFVEIPPAPADNVVTFNLYNESTLLFTKTVETNRVFRLPAGFKQDVVSVEVISQCEVQEIRIGDTPASLALV